MSESFWATLFPLSFSHHDEDFHSRRPKSERNRHGRVKDDVFKIIAFITIIIVLLLTIIIGYIHDPFVTAPHANLNLPALQAETISRKTTALFISQDGISIGNRFILPLEKVQKDLNCIPRKDSPCQMTFVINPLYMDNDAENFKIPALYHALAETVSVEWDECFFLKRPWTGSITIFSDKAIPYKTISRVLYTVGLAGYHRVYFAGLMPGKTSDY